MFKTAVGQAEGIDTARTMACVLSQCREQLQETKPDAGIVFTADHFDPEIIRREILNAFPGIKLAGCTTGGEISSAYGFSQDSICLTLFASDTISMAEGFSSEISPDPGSTIEKILAQATPHLKGEIKGCLIFAGSQLPLTGNFLKELYLRLGPECAIFGGVAGTDDFEGLNARIFSSATTRSNGFSLLLFSGPLRIESVLCNSWEPVGYKSTVKEADGGNIRRIGGRSALKFFRHTFGPYSRPLPEMPLALFDEKGRFHLRSIQDFNEEEGSVYTPIPIREGSTIQLTEATPARLLDNLKEGLTGICDIFKNSWSPQSAILLSCTSRRWILGTRTKEELEQTQKILPVNIPVSGFYTFGEIASLSKGGVPKLHNCTMVALLMGEENNTSEEFTSHRHNRSCFTTQEREKLIVMKMERALESQRRLEMQKDSFTNVLRRTSSDLAEANRKIRKHNLIMKESLTMAQEVQQSLLPNYSPIMDGFEIVGRSISCDETGGDYLDYLPDENGLSVIVGDAAGHGVAAALVMTTARALLRMRADMGGRPKDQVYDINRLLTEDLQPSGRFMTFFYLYLNSKNRTLTWIRAGHDPALVYSPEEDRFRELMGEGIALGVMEDFEFSQYSTPP